MKNIHLIPTPNPSRLGGLEYIINDQGIDKRAFKLKLWNKLIPNKDLKDVGYIPLNLYITSDKEIKEGDYVLYHEDKISQVLGINIDELKLDRGGVWRSSCKKIILTTDQDLIADGVQAIDDEFLEWFVKNPSCESVEVKKENICARCHSNDVDECWSAKECSDGRYDKIRYKIIIPQEEPKDVVLGYKTSLVAQMLDKIGLEEPKQETLAEAAEKFWDKLSFDDAFKAGAKWQQERSYSEEDLRNAYRWGTTVNHGTKEHFNEWFEQFKKK
jgi:hypothetical protein